MAMLGMLSGVLLTRISPLVTSPRYVRPGSLRFTQLLGILAK